MIRSLAVLLIISALAGCQSMTPGGMAPAAVEQPQPAGVAAADGAPDGLLGSQTDGNPVDNGGIDCHDPANFELAPCQSKENVDEMKKASEVQVISGNVSTPAVVSEGVLKEMKGNEEAPPPDEPAVNLPPIFIPQGNNPWHVTTPLKPIAPPGL